MIHCVDFRIECVTSMFIHDADGKSASWRGSTVRGLTRYWFRAMAGGLLSTEKLKTVEGRIFGSTDIGPGINFKILNVFENSDECYLLPHKNSSKSGCLLPGSSCTLRLVPRRHSEDALVRLRIAAWSFWLAATLGGFGQRSRRGAGSVRIERVTSTGMDGLLLPESSPVHGNPDELCRYIDTGIRNFRDVIFSSFPETKQRSLRRGIPEFPQLFSPQATAIGVSQLPPNYQNEKDTRALIMQELRDYKSPVMGLPYMKPKKDKSGKYERKIYGRHASPLWIHLHRGKGKNNSFLLVSTVMKTRSIVDKVKSEAPKLADWSSIDNYIRENISQRRVKVIAAADEH